MAQILTFVFLTAILHSTSASLRAGVAKVDASAPIGVPLAGEAIPAFLTAGYNHGPRRVPKWPEPKNGNYTTVRMFYFLSYVVYDAQCWCDGSDVCEGTCT